MKLILITKSKKEIHLQEYWIKYKGSIPISDIIYHDDRKCSNDAIHL